MKIRQKVKWNTVLLLTLLLLASAASANAQRPADGKESREVREYIDLLAEYPDDAQGHYRLGILLAQQDRREEALGHFEEAVRLAPEDPVFSNEYRVTCVWWKQYGRSIDFFEDLVDKNQTSPELRLQLALAFVDKMPSVSLGIVGQGLTSNKSINQLTKAIEMDSTSWEAWYARGMNHLHWPRAMRHAPKAIADFEQAKKIQDSMGFTAPKRFFELTYLGLGDAQLKDKRHDEARETWRQGLELFPKSSHLRKRLSFEDNEELEEFMKTARSLKKQIDTDLSIIWAP